jgi:hypothetical protein
LPSTTATPAAGRTTAQNKYLFGDDVILVQSRLGTMKHLNIGDDKIFFKLKAHSSLGTL